MTTNKHCLEIAKKIRAEMLTKEASCYRLDMLPKTATVQSIAKLIYAMQQSTDEEREYWQDVFKTPLYIKDGSAYCCILAHIYRTGAHLK